MQTQKEIVRDSVLTTMRPYLNAVTMDILNQAIVNAMAHVDVVETETLPATSENTNDYILNVYMTKKVQKLSRQTAKYYLETIRHFIQFTNKSLLDINDMDVELYLQWYHATGFRGAGNIASTVNNERRNLSAFFTWMRKQKMINENPVDGVEPFAEIEKPIEFLADWEMEALRDACRTEVNGVTNFKEYREHLRDRAVLEFFRSTAIRVSECVPINRQDIDWQ